MDFVRNRLGKFTDLAYRLKVWGDGGVGPSFGGKGFCLLLLCFFLWGRSMKS